MHGGLHGDAVRDAGWGGGPESGEGGERGRGARGSVEGEVRGGVARDVDAHAFGCKSAGWEKSSVSRRGFGAAGH